MTKSIVQFYYIFSGRCTCEIFSIIFFAAETIKRRMLLHLTLSIMSPAIVNQSKALECTFLLSLKLREVLLLLFMLPFILLFHVDDLRNDVGKWGRQKNKEWRLQIFLTDASGCNSLEFFWYIFFVENSIDFRIILFIIKPCLFLWISAAKKYFNLILYPPH